MAVKVCFMGGARFSVPLDATNEKKFRELKTVGEIFVIGFSQDLRLRRFNQHGRFYLLPKLKVPALRYAEIFLLGSPLALWLILRHGVQVLVAQSPYEGFAAASTKIIAGCLGYKIMLVVESHGDFEESLFMQRRILLPSLYRFLMNRAASFALKQADILRAISVSVKQQLEQWLPGRPIVQFPTWTDIDVFLDGAFRKKDIHTQEVLYAGVLIRRKGIHHLINAFAYVAKHFPQVRLIIVGHEEDKIYAAELKEQVKRTGVDGRVQFIGTIPQAELAMWMRRACVFALPSVSEGLGRVVLEAMATGTPAIGSNVGGIPEMIKDRATGFLVPPADEAALAEKLRWLLEHPEEAQSMGEHARRFAERFFSTKTYVESYREIFQACRNVLEERNDHAPNTL